MKNVSMMTHYDEVMAMDGRETTELTAGERALLMQTILESRKHRIEISITNRATQDELLQARSHAEARAILAKAGAVVHVQDTATR